jgi:hypothetical protein
MKVKEGERVVTLTNIEHSDEESDAQENAEEISEAEESPATEE